MSKGKWALVLAVLVVLAAVTFIAGCGPRQVVRAQRFQLIDGEGRTRVEIRMGRMGGTDGRSPAIWLCDQKEQARIELSLFPDGSPRVALADDKGRTRAELALADGRPGVALADEKGQPRAALGVFPDGNPTLGIADENGKWRAMVMVNSDGSPGLGFLDAKGKWRAALRIDADGPTLVMSNPEGRVVWSAP